MMIRMNLARSTSPMAMLLAALFLAAPMTTGAMEAAYAPHTPVLCGPFGLPGDDKDDKKKDEEADEDEDEDEEEDEYYALIGGDVYTGTGALLRGATILSKNGVIEEIGFGLYLPEETETLDVTGMRVYPGLVAMGATGQISAGSFSADDSAEDDVLRDPHYGLDDVIDRGVRAIYGHVEPGEDGAEPHDDHETREFEYGELKSQIEDSFDPFSQYLVLALATGITSAEQSGAAVKLRRGEIKDVLMKEKNLTSMTWTVSSPGSIRGTREKFAKAAEHLRNYREWMAIPEKERKDVKEPKKPKGFNAGAFSVLQGATLARFTANAREDLDGIAKLAQEYHFRPVIFGCREGWTVAEELGRAGAMVVVTPRDRSPKDERLVRSGGTSIENAAILHEHGVQVAIRPASTRFDLGGITGRDLLHLPTEAAFGVRGGLSEEAAIASISLIPARILGVDHRVGTLEVGKDMDAIITDGDLLHYQTFVQWAVVAGKLVYDKEEEIFFAHIRPRPARPEPEVPEPVAAEEESEETEGELTEEEPAADDESAEGDDEPAEDDAEPADEDSEESGDEEGEEQPEDSTVDPGPSI